MTPFERALQRSDFQLQVFEELKLGQVQVCA